MSKVFDEIKRGLEQAVAYEKGTLDPSGAVLAQGDLEHCQGNGKHEGFECCCDECDHFLECYPEHQADLEEALEDLRDLKAAERAMEEYKKNPTTYTFDEVLEELKITREELDKAANHPDIEKLFDGYEGDYVSKEADFGPKKGKEVW